MDSFLTPTPHSRGCGGPLIRTPRWLFARAMSSLDVGQCSAPVKNGSEPDRVLLGSAERADDLGLRQIFAAFQIKSEFLCVESE
jgi:hypothetical protein